MSSNSVKTILSALTAASKSVKGLPPAPVFDPTPLRAAFEASQLPEKFIENALRESEKKFVATHGDNGERLARIILADIAESLGGIEELGTIAGRMAKEARTEGKVNVTASEWKDACNGEGEDFTEENQTLVEKASDLRKAGKAWSEIEEALNLSPSSRSALYLVSKEFTDLFPIKSAD